MATTLANMLATRMPGHCRLEQGTGATEGQHNGDREFWRLCCCFVVVGLLCFVDWLLCLVDRVAVSWCMSRWNLVPIYIDLESEADYGHGICFRWLYASGTTTSS